MVGAKVKGCGSNFCMPVLAGLCMLLAYMYSMLSMTPSLLSNLIYRQLSHKEGFESDIPSEATVEQRLQNLCSGSPR